MKISSWDELVNALIARKVSFVVTFFLVFLFSYAILAWLDFLPEPVNQNTQEIKEEIVNDTKSVEDNIVESIDNDNLNIATSSVTEVPTSITFDSLNKTVTVLNPKSRSVSELDTALLDGAVRHPDSATLNQMGTVFILAHSSYLPNVINKNFQAFNGIQDLKWGDLIRVKSENSEYIYRVNKVYKAEAADTTVPIAGDSKRLVLATCNSFGSVDDRYIVEAELDEVIALSV
ncbi:MAG: sortase [Candidatus Paceibacterota bacterium]